MGLPMQEIHSPTVESSSHQFSSSSDDVPITDLIKQKDELETEMQALGSVLESHGVTMSTPLLTPDGFPRADIDIAQIRTTRARIIRLQNDHKALMARIEPKLYEYFAANRSSTPPSIDSTPAASARSPPDQLTAAPIVTTTNSAAQPARSSGAGITSTSESGSGSGSGSDAAAPDVLPFALVNSVTPSSPADTAGLKAGDKIIQFGEATWLNNEKLSLVAQIVRRSEGMRVPVVVSRTEPLGVAQLRLTLVPRTDWGGRGALGCHLLPI